MFSTRLNLYTKHSPPKAQLSGIPYTDEGLQIQTRKAVQRGGIDTFALSATVNIKKNLEAKQNY